MNKGDNINKHKHLYLEEDLKQINFLDQRFYKYKEEYFPSITYILQYFPKGKFFEDWLKDVGYNSEHIVKNSAYEGTQIHSLIEEYLQGKEIFWLDNKGNARYSMSVWNMLLKFTEFWETVNPKLVHSEILVFSEKYKIAGTCDLVVEIDDKLWILDIKSSNNLHTSYDLQTAAYAKCFEECFGKKIHKTGILWLKSSKRSSDSSGKKIQGKGWELYESPRDIDHNFNLFLNIYELFKLENPYDKPIFNKYPTSVKLNK